jgi:hypothetical protein
MPELEATAGAIARRVREVAPIRRATFVALAYDLRWVGLGTLALLLASLASFLLPLAPQKILEQRAGI